MTQFSKSYMSQRLPLAIGMLITLLYLETYFSSPYSPGNRTESWWGWWDQSHYLLSAHGLAHGLFDPSLHWYPLGYALLGAPFIQMSAGHPFALPDLGCLLLTYLAFLSFSCSAGISRPVAALLFLAGAFGSEALRNVWAEPWNTTLSTALIWSMLAIVAQLFVGMPTGRLRIWRLGALGWLASAIVFCRPTDALLVAICVGWLGNHVLRHRLMKPLDIVPLLVGGLVASLPEALLWWRIYGWHESPYMEASKELGFSLRGLWWKTYMLLLTPRPWFPTGAGLVERWPWLIPGIAGIVALPWIERGRTRSLLALLAISIVSYDLLFFSYVDLLPSGLWRFHNVHYFKWTIPGLLLLAYVLLRALVRGRHVPSATALVLVLLLSGVKLMPERVEDGSRAWMVQLSATPPDMRSSYQARLALRDKNGSLLPIIDYRALPDAQGWRLIALRRPFVGRLVGLDTDPWSAALRGAQTRWGMTVRYGVPCWLSACRWQESGKKVVDHDIGGRLND